MVEKFDWNMHSQRFGNDDINNNDTGEELSLPKKMQLQFQMEQEQLQQELEMQEKEFELENLRLKEQEEQFENNLHKSWSNILTNDREDWLSDDDESAAAPKISTHKKETYTTPHVEDAIDFVNDDDTVQEVQQHFMGDNVDLSKSKNNNDDNYDVSGDYASVNYQQQQVPNFDSNNYKFDDNIGADQPQPMERKQHHFMDEKARKNKSYQQNEEYDEAIAKQQKNKQYRPQDQYSTATATIEEPENYDSNADVIDQYSYDIAANLKGKQPVKKKVVTKSKRKSKSPPKPQEQFSTAGTAIEDPEDYSGNMDIVDQHSLDVGNKIPVKKVVSKGKSKSPPKPQEQFSTAGATIEDPENYSSNMDIIDQHSLDVGNKPPAKKVVTKGKRVSKVSKPQEQFSGATPTIVDPEEYNGSSVDVVDQYSLGVDVMNKQSKDPTPAKVVAKTKRVSTTTKKVVTKPANNPKLKRTSQVSTRKVVKKQPPPKQATPPKVRKKKADGSGLSELAKQLRELQAKNDHQANEIDRLERKLRIQSEMTKNGEKGFNASEIRVELEKACQQEAHNELMNRIHSLEAQLDAANMKNAANAAIGSSDNATQQTMNDSANREKEISNYQLRIGELEELEDTLRLEMNELYMKLQDQSFEANQMQIEKSEQDLTIQKLMDQIAQLQTQLANEKKEKEALQAQKDELAKQLKGTKLELKLEKIKTENLTNQLQALQQKLKQQKDAENHKKEQASAAEKKQQQQQLQQQQMVEKGKDDLIAKLYQDLHKTRSDMTALEQTCDEQHEVIQDLHGKLSKQEDQNESLTAKVDELQASYDKAQKETTKLKSFNEHHRDIHKNLKQQLEQRQKDIKLQKEQYNSRFKLLSSQLKDCQQQLSSLYTAYELLMSDNKEQDNLRLELQDNLRNADLAMAKQLENASKKPATPGGQQQPPQQTNLKILVKPQQLQQQQQPTVVKPGESTSRSSSPKPTAAARSSSPKPTAEDTARIAGTSSAATSPQSPSEGVAAGAGATMVTMPSSPAKRGNSRKSLGKITNLMMKPQQPQQHTPQLTQQQQQQQQQQQPLEPSNDPSNSSVASSNNQNNNHGENTNVNINAPRTLMEGYLLKYDKNILKGWKKRYFVLLSNNSTPNYQLTYSSGPKDKLKGIIPVTIGVSTISQSHNSNSSSQVPNFVFVLHVNPNNSNAPVLMVGTDNVQEYEVWMSAMAIATRQNIKSQTELQERMDLHVAQRMQLQEGNNPQQGRQQQAGGRLLQQQQSQRYQQQQQRQQQQQQQQSADYELEQQLREEEEQLARAIAESQAMAQAQALAQAVQHDGN